MAKTKEQAANLEIEVTQEILEDNPELKEAGVEVGETVKVSEDPTEPEDAGTVEQEKAEWPVQRPKGL